MDRSVIPGLCLLARGKTHDLYEIDAHTLLFVSTDALSALDVNLRCDVPHKGRVMTALSLAWFDGTRDLIANHLVSDQASALAKLAERVGPAAAEAFAGRALVVKRLVPVRLEAVVRGYLVGNLWKEYAAAIASLARLHPASDLTVSGSTGERVSVWGHDLPTDMCYGQRLPKPLFTPSTKAPPGSPDVYLDHATARDVIEREGGHGHLFDAVHAAAIAIYERMSKQCAAQGITMADTKMEFGVDPESGVLMVMDELGTPDTSRLWYSAEYAAWYAGSPRVNTFPPSIDKQHVKTHLEACGWKRGDPAPNMPPEVIRLTSLNYLAAERLLGVAAAA